MPTAKCQVWVPPPIGTLLDVAWRPPHGVCRGKITAIRGAKNTDVFVTYDGDDGEEYAEPLDWADADVRQAVTVVGCQAPVAAPTSAPDLQPRRKDRRTRAEKEHGVPLPRCRRRHRRKQPLVNPKDQKQQELVATSHQPTSTAIVRTPSGRMMGGVVNNLLAVPMGPSQQQHENRPMIPTSTTGEMAGTDNCEQKAAEAIEITNIMAALNVNGSCTGPHDGEGEIVSTMNRVAIDEQARAIGSRPNCKLPAQHILYDDGTRTPIAMVAGSVPWWTPGGRVDTSFSTASTTSACTCRLLGSASQPNRSPVSAPADRAAGVDDETELKLIEAEVRLQQASVSLYI